MTARHRNAVLVVAALIQVPGSLLLVSVLFGILEGGPDYFPNLCQVLGVLQAPR